MLEHIKVIKTFSYRKSEAPTHYIKTCNSCLSNQDIFSEKSEALDPQPMLEYMKII